MMRKHTAPTAHCDRISHSERVQRHGYTMIELLVTIVVIAILAALIAPAIQASRRQARRAECLNNMRNVGLGLLNASSTTGGVLTPLTSKMMITNASGHGTMSVGWPISILPQIENVTLQNQIRNNASIAAGSATMSSTENVWIQTLTCPEDLDSYGQNGGLSYVVNAGYISSEIWGGTETSSFFHQPYLINWKGSTVPAYRSTDGTSTTGTPSATDMQIALSTGVFWRIVGDSVVPTYQPSVDYVSGGDGTTNTLMLTENLNAGPWSSTDVNSIAFGIRVPVTTSNFSPNVGTTSPCGEFKTTASLNADFPCSTFPAMSAGSLINQPAGTALASATGIATTTTAAITSTTQVSTADNCTNSSSGNTTVATTVTRNIPRPSSQHTGGVNAMMVDGSVRFLSDNIDPFVYGRLVTSNGATYAEASLNQACY